MDGREGGRQVITKGDRELGRDEWGREGGRKIGEGGKV